MVIIPLQVPLSGAQGGIKPPSAWLAGWCICLPLAPLVAGRNAWSDEWNIYPGARCAGAAYPSVGFPVLGVVRVQVLMFVCHWLAVEWWGWR